MAAENNNKVARPPVVVVMGHVDHGKTTLLDYIRKANVAAREAGGITQAISAYEIEHSGKKITFIDTPGHEAFTKMRSRGASAADLAILVVAADESVKPQTVESIRILKETKTPFVVAVTKSDRPGANVDKVKADLADNEVMVEGYGGQVSWHAVSGKTGEGVSDLLDLILLTTEMEDLSYDPAAVGSGFILEARLTKQRGIETVVILKNGTLRRGEPIATPSACGRVKILEDFLGRSSSELFPSAPALVIGFEDMPAVGEEFVLDSSLVAVEPKNSALVAAGGSFGGDGESNNCNLILKSSDAGSLEALSGIVRALQTEKPIKVVGESVGEITDGDVQLAISTGSAIIGFKTKVQKTAIILAETRKIKIATSEIIYELVQKIEKDIAKDSGTQSTGELEVLAVFNQERPNKQLVGGKVLSGTLRVRQPLEIIRDGQVVGRGRIVSLRKGKEETGSITEGLEAGVILDSEILAAVGDKLSVK